MTSLQPLRGSGTCERTNGRSCGRVLQNVKILCIRSIQELQVLIGNGLLVQDYRLLLVYNRADGIGTHEVLVLFMTVGRLSILQLLASVYCLLLTSACSDHMTEDLNPDYANTNRVIYYYVV